MAVEAELIVAVEMSIDDAISDLKKAKNAIDGTTKQADKMTASLKKTQEQFRSLAPQARAAGLAVVAAFTGATKVFSDFDKSATNVQNIIDGTAQEIGVLRDAVMALPPELGDATELMNALYQTISSGIPQDNAIEFLELHAKAAKGNLADLTETVDAGSSIMNAYNLEISEMGQVLDSMTKTVDLGKVTFSDLSSNIGKGISVAAAAGVSYQELMATIATLTLSGLSVEESMTGIRNILIKSLKPASSLSDAVKSLNVDMSSTSLKAKGFSQWLGDIAMAVQGNNDAMAELFPNIRALGPILNLTSEQGGKKFESTLNDIASAAGKVDDNFERTSQRLHAQTSAMVNELKKLGIEFGALASEQLLPLIKGIRGMVTEFRELSPATKQNIIDFGKWSLAISAFVLVAPKAIGAILAIQKGLKGIAASNVATKLGVSSRALGGWALAAGGAVIAAEAFAMWLDTLNQLTPEFKRNLEEATSAEMRFAEAAKELGISASDLIEKYGSLEEALEKATGRDMGAEYQELRDIYHNMAMSTSEATEELTRFKRELAESGDLATYISYHGDLEAVYKRAQQSSGKLAEVLAEVRAEMQAEADAAKASEAAAAAAAKAHLEQKNAILGKAAAFAKEAAAVKKSLAETESKLKTDKEIAEQARQFEEDQKAFQETTEDWYGIYSNLKESMEETWQSLPELVGDSISGAISKIKNMAGFYRVPVKVEVEPPSPSEISQVMGELSGFTSAFGQTLGDAFYDAFQGNLPSIQELFRGFSQDIGATLFDSLSTAINDAFAAATEAMEGGGEGEGGFGAGIGAFFGELDKDFWMDAGSSIATAFAGQAQQDADKTGAAIGGAVAGAIQGAKFGVVGAVIGAVVGGIIGYLGASAADTPRVRANIGYTGLGFYGDLETRKAQLFTEEMERTWIQQQAAIFDAFKMGYRRILEMFGDPELLEGLSLTNLPSFEMPVGQWMEASASDLATYLKETYWPDAFRQYFAAALEAGLGRYGVTDASVAALMDELERLPGSQTMQALADFVQAIVGSAELLERMDFESVWQEVIQSPRAAMEAMGQEIVDQLNVWATGWEGLTGIEQAQQLIRITELVDQARQAEIQYLQQIYQIQQQINRSIADQIEMLVLGGMTSAEQAEYFWNQIQSIFEQLQDPDISAGNAAQLVADAQNYIRQIEQLMGDDLDTVLFGDISDPFINLLPPELMAEWQGLTGREGLIKMLEYLNSLSDLAIEGEIADSELRLAEYNRILTETNALLLTFGDLLAEINGNLADLILNPPETIDPAIDITDETDDPIAEGDPPDPDIITEHLTPAAVVAAAATADPVNNPILLAIDRMSALVESLPATLSYAMSQVVIPSPQQTNITRIDGSIQGLISVIDTRIAQYAMGAPAGGSE